MEATYLGNLMALSIVGGGYALLLSLWLMLWNRQEKIRKEVSENFEKTRQDLGGRFEKIIADLNGLSEKIRSALDLHSAQFEITDRALSAATDAEYSSSHVARGNQLPPTTTKLRRALDLGSSRQGEKNDAKPS